MPTTHTPNPNPARQTVHIPTPRRNLWNKAHGGTSGDKVTWGEAALTSSLLATSLTRKGVVTNLAEPGDAPEWNMWADYISPHTRLVWKSLLSSVLIKCVNFALTSVDLTVNIRSLCRGIGIKRYPRD